MKYSTRPAILYLKYRINRSRQRLQMLRESKGFTDLEVLAANIELDHLMNQYQKLSPDLDSLD